MAKKSDKRSSESKIAAIDAALADSAEAGRQAQEAALKLKLPFIVAHAANRATEHRLSELLERLEGAFELFFELPVKGDPGLSGQSGPGRGVRCAL